MRPFPGMADSKNSLEMNPLFDQRIAPTLLDLISKSWLINAVVLLSMTLQMMLACGGTFRHCRSNVILQLVLWLAYMSSDAVAVYALGNMAEQSQPGLFGIFAPLLLIHLGGPDTITAYSTADNELWTRHMIIMMFQTSVAMYVIYISGLKDYLLVAAILLAIVGATKYGERTLALRCASFSQIVSSANPMYKYMSCDYGRSCQYMVMGVTQWDKEYKGAERREKMKVNIYDVWEEEGQKATDNYMLCLSHALFKMYKRRYVNLYLFERGLPDTRRFFLGEPSQDMKIPPLTEDKLFPVIEMELKFLYDALFTKSSGTAYSKLGVSMRLLNTLTLGIAGFFTLKELGKEHAFLDEALSAQRTVTYIVIAGGFLVEFSQLLRTIASDWTLVWLICANIRIKSIENQNSIQRRASKIIKSVIRALSKFREKRGRRYWKREIQQYCIVDVCSQISPLIWKWSRYFPMSDLIIRWYIDSSPIEDDLKKFIVEKVKERCSPEEDIEACKAKLTSFNSSLERGIGDTGLSSFSGTEQEHLILHWHVATTICEMEYNMDDSEDVEGKRYFNMSKKLSKYCAYLLVSRPKLLPLHPDTAKMEYMKLHNDLVDYCHSESKTTLKDFSSKHRKYYARTYGSTFCNGVELAKKLFEIGRQNKQRLWEVIARHWAEVLIYYAVFGKSTMHAEYLTVGGEFLTHLWVLIGHMGCGDQN